MGKCVLRACAGVLLAALCAELLVRQFWVHKRVFLDDYVKTGEPFGRTVLGLEGWAISHRVAHGIRAGHADSGTPILVLGDSYTEALNVSDADVFTAVAEREVRGAGAPLQLLNAGVAGRSMADYILFAQRHQDLFDPAWVVIEFTQHDFMRDAFAEGRNHLQRNESGDLVAVRREYPDGSGIKAMIWSSPSIAFRFTFNRLKQFTEVAESRPPMFSALVNQDLGEYTPDPVGEMLDLAYQRYNGRVTFLFAPEVFFGPARINDSVELQRFEQHCQATGYSCVIARDEFMALARQHQSPTGFLNTNFNVGHMNRRGHQALADALSAELLRLYRAGEISG